MHLLDHVSVAVPDLQAAAVRAFHEAALRCGGTCDGPPGLRASYHPAYYAAFVLDPHGNRLEAACHVPERKSP